MPTPPRPISRAAASKAWVRALEAIRIMDERPEVVLPALLDELAAQYGAAPALLDPAERLTYRGLAERANRYARWALAQGIAPGDPVALLLGNCADYAAIWLGITRVGGVVALLNTNLVGDALLHCIGAAKAGHLIAGAAFAPTVAAIASRLPSGLHRWGHGADAPAPRIDAAASALDATPLDVPPPGPRDRALLIYTSGTTGLPKAAHVSHGRVVEWSFWFAGMMDARAEDRLYDCLPMYHSTGGVVAIGAMLVRGGSVVIRPRFSASRFWDDVAEEGCTIFQYIGELCRYLERSPPHPHEAAHRLRLACGNGLRGDVWERFQDRFAIPQVLEFYAATEGNVSLYNVEGKPGAIGRVPSFLAHRLPVALVRCDTESNEPVRGADGLCIACSPDEPGEAIGRIQADRQAPARQFDGYTDEAASARKVLRDVFAPGDTWFRTGDLMRRDTAGYFYFLDRLGDTFRWKGENVSTTEVAAVVAACPGVNEAVVYGVAVPGEEGRAGMAAITAAPDFDPAVLHAHLAANLPEYARPVFLRLCVALDVTGTFKPMKGQLAREGYSPAVGADPVWYSDRARGAFVPCDAALRMGLAAAPGTAPGAAVTACRRD